MLSHLFLYSFIPSELYFIPILPGRENRVTILIVFYFYFKPILKQDWTKGCILFLFSFNKWKNNQKNRLFSSYFYSLHQ